jgi:hypothetical protein
MIRAKERGEAARRVKEVVEIQSVDIDSGHVKKLNSFVWDPATDKFQNSIGESGLLRKICFEKGMNYRNMKGEFDNRKKVLEWMERHDVTKYDQVAEFISLYYRDPKTLMDWVKKNIPPYETKTKVKRLLGFVTGLKTVD